MITTLLYMLPIMILDGNDWDAVLSALTSSVSVSSISGVLVSAITASIGIVFFWWAARKVTQVLFSAFRSGKLHA